MHAASALNAQLSPAPLRCDGAGYFAGWARWPADSVGSAEVRLRLLGNVVWAPLACRTGGSCDSTVCPNPD